MKQKGIFLILIVLLNFVKLPAQNLHPNVEGFSQGSISDASVSQPIEALTEFLEQQGAANQEITWVQSASDITAKAVVVYRFEGYHNGFRVADADAVVMHHEGINWDITVPQKRTYKFSNPSAKSLLSGQFPDMLPDAFRDKPLSSFEQVWMQENNGEHFELVWILESAQQGDLMPMRGLFNPETGIFTPTQDHICFADSAGFAHTKYHGNCALPAWFENGAFSLKSTLRGQRIETINLNNQTGYTQITPFLDSDNIWGPPYPTGSDYAADAHYCAVKYYDFLQSSFSRNSIDNNGYPLVSYLNYGQGLVNAFWNGNSVVYGGGNNTTQPYTSLDIAGHEFTHGLIQKTANLNYSGEPGTINEAIADMLGAALEFYGAPQQANWTIAESSGTTLRSMAFPKQFNQPDTYHGNFWYYGSGDNGGVHINSGFINKWFYLLAVGGQGTNDLGFSYSIQGIGIEKATSIVYETLLSRLIPASGFTDFRNGSMLSVQQLYGACSNETATCMRAWEAVGFGLNQGAILPLNTPSGTSFCDGDSLIITTEAFPGATYEWFVNSQLYVVTTMPFLEVRTEGNWNVVRRYCNVAVSSGQIFIDRLPIPSVTTSDETICAGATVSPVSFPLGGSYSIPLPWSGSTVQYTYTFVNTSGCHATATGVITVVPLPEAEITTQINSIPLNGSPVKLEGTGNGIFTGPGVSNGWFYPEAAGLGGPYEIVYTVENAAGCLDQSTIEITVTPPCQMLPNAPEIKMSGELIAGVPVKITVSGVDTGLTVLWQLPPSIAYTVSSDGHSIEFVPSESYINFKVIIKNNCGEEVVIEKLMTPVSLPVSIAIFPNPAQDFLNVSISGMGTNQFSYRIYNSLGQSVLNGVLNSTTNTVSLLELQSGWYFIEIGDEEHHYHFPFKKNN